LIEKGLQLIADSFLDQLAMRCERVGVPVTRQLLEGINYEEIVREVNRGEGRLPGLIGFDPNRAAGYDGGAKTRSDVRLGENGRIVAEEEDEAAKLVGSSGRKYDLVAIGAHVLFGNIKDVLSVQASKVFKFEEQEELHNNIIDKGLLKLCQANLKRAEVMAQQFSDVPIKTQILVGKPFQVIMQWAEEIKPSLLIIGRHGAHRIDGTELGSQAENLVRLAPSNVL